MKDEFLYEIFIYVNPLLNLISFSKTLIRGTVKNSSLPLKFKFTIYRFMYKILDLSKFFGLSKMMNGAI